VNRTVKSFSIIAATAVVLMLVSSATSNSNDDTKPWDTPSYRKDIPATQAVSRPEPGRTGWPLWMKHHEDRKRWVAQRKVDLLMIGDSITFRWSRDGKKVWDEYYAKRNGCNIGSSGDWTKHMLWHFRAIVASPRQGSPFKHLVSEDARLWGLKMPIIGAN